MPQSVFTALCIVNDVLPTIQYELSHSHNISASQMALYSLYSASHLTRALLDLVKSRPLWSEHKVNMSQNSALRVQVLFWMWLRFTPSTNVSPACTLPVQSNIHSKNTNLLHYQPCWDWLYTVVFDVGERNNGQWLSTKPIWDSFSKDDNLNVGPPRFTAMLFEHFRHSKERLSYIPLGTLYSSRFEFPNIVGGCKKIQLEIWQPSGFKHEVIKFNPERSQHAKKH